MGCLTPFFCGHILWCVAWPPFFVGSLTLPFKSRQIKKPSFPGNWKKAWKTQMNTIQWKWNMCHIFCPVQKGANSWNSHQHILWRFHKRISPLTYYNWICSLFKHKAQCVGQIRGVRPSCVAEKRFRGMLWPRVTHRGQGQQYLPSLLRAVTMLGFPDTSWDRVPISLAMV